jgi:hypothetical protein
MKGTNRVADRGAVNRAFGDNTTSARLTILQAPPVVWRFKLRPSLSKVMTRLRNGV